MPQKNSVTWLNYIDDFSRKEIATKQLMTEGIDKVSIFRHFPSDIRSYGMPYICLLDYTSGKYISFSHHVESVLHFSNRKFLDGGVGFVQEVYHPADFRLFNEQIFDDRLKILKSIPQDQQKDYIFSFNYRIKTGKGDYINLLQRNSFIPDENGNPLLSLCVVSNIDHFKSENPIIHLVEKVDPTTSKAELVEKNTYYLYEEDRIFSKREREILLYIAEGLTSKQIADKLFISEHTVINHKRNMHHKSNTQNTVALISFAFRQHLL